MKQNSFTRRRFLKSIGAAGIVMTGAEFLPAGSLFNDTGLFIV